MKRTESELAEGIGRWLPSLSVGRPVTIVMSFLALMVLGAIAWVRMPVEMMPGSYELPMLWVWVPYGDSTPRETEQQVLAPLEEQVSTAPGIKSMRGYARSGNAQLTLEFHRSVDMDVAYNAVVDRLERAMVDLPDDVERYWIYRWDPSDEPVMWAGMAIPEEVEDPYWLANEVIAKKLERVAGVGKVDVWGVDARLVLIEFHLDQLIANRIDLGSVVRKLGADNFQLATGRLEDEGKVRYVRSLARFGSVDEIRQYPIGDGKVLGDIATVKYGLTAELSINHIDGQDGAALAINKESGANTVEVTQRVTEAFAELEQDPRLAGTRVHSFFDQGKMIQDSIDDLLYTAMTGGAFAVVVLFAFLREWRLTLLIAACIPFALLLTVTTLYFTGRSLNLLSLMGLMLAVGMVVDNSIVVVESIYARRQHGEERKKAAVGGTADVNLAITLSTMTTMVVFLPIILMTDDADFSFFMGELGMPVVWALAASLVVALVFTPLTTTLLKGRPEHGGGLPPEPGWIRWLTRKYTAGLHWVLTHRTDALVGILVATFVTIVVPVEAVGCQDDADGNIGQFEVRYEIDGNFNYAERLAIVERFEGWIEGHRDDWGVRVTRSRLSSTSTHGRTYVYLHKEREEGQPSREEVIDEATEDLPQIAGVTAQIGWSSSGGPPPNQLTVVLHGEDTATLEDLGAEVARLAEGVPGVLGAWPEMEEEGGQEMRFEVDREAAARYGVNAASIGRTVSFAMRGTPLPNYHEGEREVDVYARFRLQDRSDLGSLLEFPIWSPETGQSVPLRALVEWEVAPGIGTIRRQDRITSWPLTIDLHKDATKEAVYASIQGALATVDFPRGYTWDTGFSFAGDEENNEAQTLALLLSVTFVFLIMGVLFESFLLPLSIITTIPMALLGVYWTLWLTNTPLDVMGGVGLVVLIGVVVNNGIVFIDLVTRLRRAGTDRTEALVEAGRRRIRPILMTALTTVFGLLPMAAGSSSFIGIPYAPLGRVVAGGMVAGTVLTLFLLPYLYSVLDDMRDSGSRWWRWVTAPRSSRTDSGNAAPIRGTK